MVLEHSGAWVSKNSLLAREVGKVPWSWCYWAGSRQMENVFIDRDGVGDLKLGRWPA